MDKKEVLLSLIPQQGVLPLYFCRDTEVSVNILRALYDAGIRAVEYTNRGEEALQNFKVLRYVCDTEFTGMYLGIGTIKHAEEAQIFIEAGADFIISPGLVEPVAQVAEETDILWIPGCMTPTEIISAQALGAKVIKLFPGNVLGPGFLSAIREVFPGLLFMPTGGVELDRENIAAWFKAGVCAVGMGSKLITREMMKAEDYTGIAIATKEVLSIISSIKVQ